MISVTGITGKYILQPALLAKHQEALAWLSASMLWKSEVVVFQKILNERAAFFKTADARKKVTYFQTLILHYRGEAIDSLQKSIRDHETRLAKMLESQNESDIQYYKEHQDIMDEAMEFSVIFAEFRNDFLHFMETANPNHM